MSRPDPLSQSIITIVVRYAMLNMAEQSSLSCKPNPAGKHFRILAAFSVYILQYGP